MTERETEVRGGNDEDEDKGSITPIEAIMFLVHAARRHVRLGVTVGLAVATVGIALALALPSRYESESRILAVQSAAVAAALSNPNRPVPAGGIDPFGGSTEILMQKSNLLWLTREAKVAERWSRFRSFPLKMKDSIFSIFVGRVSEKDMNRALAEQLERQMYVAHDNTTLTIHVAWQDPESAWKLTQLAQSRFLELRRTQELAVITAAISVNEDEVKHAAEGIDQSLQELIRTKARALHGVSSSTLDAKQADAGAGPNKVASGTGRQNGTAAAVAPVSSASPAADKKLAARLADIRQQVRELEAPWQRRLAELKFQLSDLRATYGPEHPLVLQQDAKIRAANNPPAELATLREQERQLLTELERETVDANKPATVAPGTRTSSNAPPSAMQPSARSRYPASDGILVIAEKEDDPLVSPAKAGLASAIQRYSDAVKRLDNARLEFTTNEVALQYRYAVIGEPERANKAAKPNRPQIILGALAAAIVLGLLSGAIRDLISGRIFEPWQVRILGLPVIGELNLSQKSK